MAGKLPKSQRVKRSHFKTDVDFIIALQKRRPGEPESVWRNRIKRGVAYEERRGSQQKAA